MIIDREHRLWFVNSKAAERMNIPASDVVGRIFEKTFPENDVLRIAPLLLEMLQTAGLEGCRYHNVSGGIVAVHRGYKS